MSKTTTPTDEMTVTKEVLGEEQEQSFLPATTADATPEKPAGVLSSLNADDEWAGVDDGDLTGDSGGRIPFLALSRKLDGGFADPETGELSSEIDFVWLAKMRSRAQWDQPFSGKDASAPDCRSFDGIVSDPASPNRKAEHCAECPLSQWKGDQPPECKESIEALVYIQDDVDAGRLARIRFGGIAVAPARSYWDSFKTRIPRRPPMAFLSRATLEPVDTDNGKFLRPRFERVAEIARAEAQPLIEERDRRIEDWKADIARSVVNRTADADEGANGKTAKSEEPFPEYDAPYGGAEHLAGVGPEYAEGEEPF